MSCFGDGAVRFVTNNIDAGDKNVAVNLNANPGSESPRGIWVRWVHVPVAKTRDSKMKTKICGCFLVLLAPWIIGLRPQQGHGNACRRRRTVPYVEIADDVPTKSKK